MPLPDLGPPPFVTIMRKLDLEPDPWQVEVLEGGHPRLLLNCCRQAGKSTVVGFLALAEALYVSNTKVLILSRSLRQAAEMFRMVADYHQRLGARLLEKRSAHDLRLQNGS